MGRHSAPDDDGDLLVVDAGAAAPVEEPAARPHPRARHAASDGELVRTDVIDPEVVERVGGGPRDVVDAVVVEDETYSVRGPAGDGPAGALTAPRPMPVIAAPQPAEVSETAEPVAPQPAAQPSPKPPKTRKERPGRADLRMLRENSSLRARSIAAIVLPFVLYTIVLVVIGALGVYLFWVWIPAILAGVLFGAQLDGAAKRAASADGQVDESA